MILNLKSYKPVGQCELLPFAYCEGRTRTRCHKADDNTYTEGHEPDDYSNTPLLNFLPNLERTVRVNFTLSC